MNQMPVPQIIYKFIYQKHINTILRSINKILFPILPKKFRIPPSGQITLHTDSGPLKIRTNQTSYLTQLLFWNGYKKFEYSEIFERLSKQVTNFLDIGSNIGYYSLLAVQSNPKINVYAFEPALGPKFFLNENIKLNSFEKNITAVDLALSNEIGVIDFYEVENLKYQYLKYNLAGEGNAGTKKTSRNFIKNTVNASTLSAFIAVQNLNHIDLIKIDTEGTEYEILLSGREEIKKYDPIVICETLFNTIEGELEDFFSELGYEFYNHTELGLTRVESLRRTADDGIRNCFFVPKSKLELVSPFIAKTQ